MSAVISLSEADVPAAWRQQVAGYAQIGFARRAGVDRLRHLAHHDPLRVLFPQPARGDIPVAALVNSSGGMVGGDRLDISFSVEDGARGMGLASAAEKIYRSSGAACEIDVTLHAGPNSWLEWVPQETILFEGARFRRRTRVTLEPGARLLAGELMIFGRAAHGETLTHGLVRDRWEVRSGGRLVWADALHMDGDLAEPLSADAGFAGARAYATLIFAADDAPDYLDRARELQDRGNTEIRRSASCVNGLLVLRWLGREPDRVRAAYGEFWGAFRQHAAALLPTLPRLWYV